MKQDREIFKKNIEKAERVILIVSWLGIASAIGVITSSLLGV